LFPTTVRENALLPTGIALGLREVMEGSGYSTSRGMLFELPPPGAGVATVMGRVPAFDAVIADAGIAAVKCALSI
jgi:hypothetical protein